MSRPRRRLVVWATGVTEGLRWEIWRIVATVPPEKVVPMGPPPPVAAGAAAAGGRVVPVPDDSGWGLPEAAAGSAR